MLNNISNLNVSLYGLTSSTKAIVNAYAKNQVEINKLRNKLNETSKEKTKKVGNYRYNDDELRAKLKEIYSRDYISSEADKALIDLVDDILPYSTVITTLECIIS